MKSVSERVPVVRIKENSGGASGACEVWLRLSAFLSTRSPNTQKTYLGIVNEWCQFLGAQPGSPAGAKAIAEATDLHAIAYRNWLEKRPGERPRMAEKGAESREIEIHRPGIKAKKVGLEATLSNATVAKKFAALRRMYRMLMACDLGVKFNPFDVDRVPAPPKEAGRKRPTEMVPFELVKKVIDGADQSEPKGLRDKAILSVLFGGGLRRSEVSALRIGDVRRSSTGTVYLYLRSTKAKKDAEQALPDWAAQTIQKLLEHRKKEGASPSDYLFVCFTGQGGKTPTPDPVSDSGIYKLFKHYCALAGAGRFVTPHSARATAITRLLAEGIPHREVQEFSRHSSIQMVELYDKRRIGVDENPGRKLKY